MKCFLVFLYSLCVIVDFKCLYMAGIEIPFHAFDALWFLEKEKRYTSSEKKLYAIYDYCVIEYWSYFVQERSSRPAVVDEDQIETLIQK